VKLAEVARPAKPRVFLIDQPGAVQANLFAGQVVPSTKDAGATRFDIANGVIGGDFTSRLNMNLREDKHWSYGARSFTSNAVGQRPWMAFAPVQIDKTGRRCGNAQGVRRFAVASAGHRAGSGQDPATEIRGLPVPTRPPHR
jgi:predicted Zn-dependent peptidase